MEAPAPNRFILYTEDPRLGEQTETKEEVPYVEKPVLHQVLILTHWRLRGSLWQTLAMARHAWVVVCGD